MEGVRVTSKNGYRTSQKKVILYIGPLSRFDDGKPDYVARLKQSIKAGEPLIPELKPYCSKEHEQPLEDYFVHFKAGSPGCTGHSRLFSQLLLEHILEELGLYSLFHTYKNTSKIQYDVYGFFKLLVFGRILRPASKCSTFCQNEDYYEPVLKEGVNPDNVYDALTFIARNRNRIIRRMNTNLVRKTHRSPEIIFYDVTNFYFETDTSRQKSRMKISSMKRETFWKRECAKWASARKIESNRSYRWDFLWMIMGFPSPLKPSPAIP